MKNLAIPSAQPMLLIRRWYRAAWLHSRVMGHLAVLAAYGLLTVLVTWPALRSFTTAIPGDGFDGWQNYWNLWWVRQALLVLGTSPFFTDYLYAPTGVSLLFHTLNIFNGLWTLPLQLNFGLAVAYNSVVLFSFAGAGYGGYLLSLHTLTHLYRPLSRPGMHLAAFVGGLIFTLAPFHLAHLLGHMQVFTMVWPPFYILTLLRALEPWTGVPLNRQPWRSAGLAGLFLVLASLVDWYHTLYLLFLTGLALLWTLARRRRLRAPSGEKQAGWRAIAAHPLIRPVLLCGAIGLSFGLVLAPLLGPMIAAASRRPDLQTGLAQNITLSADLLAFVTPSEFHPLWGAWAKSIANNFSSTTSEQLVFAGFVPLALGLFALVRGGSRPAVRFWGLVTAVFFILALGPYLHIGGNTVTLAGRPVPLPYLLLYQTVPFIGLTRSLSRYDLMVMLGLGVLAAVAVYRLTYQTSPLARLRLGRWRLLPGLVIILICLEFLAVPYPVSPIDIPAFYRQIAAEPEMYTLAELPMNWDRPTPLLHQTVHGKRLLTAYTSRDNPLELAWRTPVFQQWRYLAPDIIDQPLDRVAPTIFYDFNLRYIVLDFWQMPPGREREETLHWVAVALPHASPVYDDGRLVVYPAPPQQAIEPYLALGNGWSGRREAGAGPVSRTFAASQPEIFLHHPQNLPLTLEITAAAAGPQELTVFADGEPVGAVKLSPDFTITRIDLPPRDAAWTKLTLGSAGPGEVAVRRLALVRRK